MKYSIIVFLSLITTYCYSSDMYNDAKLYYILKKQETRITLKDNTPSVSSEIHEKKQFNSIVSEYYGHEMIYNNFFYDISNINASISHPNSKGRYKTTEITDIQEKTRLTSTFYNDNSYFEFLYPNIQKGSRTDLKYKMEITDAHFMHNFHFTDMVPIKNAEFIITTDKNIEIGWKLYGQNTDAIKFEKTVIDDQITYKWSKQDSPELIVEDHSPGHSYNSAHIIVYIKSYSVNGEKINYLNDTDDLNKWYSGFLEKIKESDNTELETITDDIIKNAKSDRNKAEIIFNWVQDNIRYIAIEDGWRGFIPFPAEQICQQRYGDCKDMSHLLYTMMSHAGLDVYHTWIGTRKLCYSYYDIPTVYVDNHMILSLELNDSIFFLDATDHMIPFGVPTSFILSKEALVNKSKTEYEIVKVPEYDAAKCIIDNKIDIQVFEKEIRGKGEKHIQTFEYSYFNHRLAANNSDVDEFISKYLELGGNNFLLNNYKFEDTSLKKETSFTFDFTIPSYVKIFDNNSYINLNLTRPLSDETIDDSRIGPYKINYKKKYIDNITLALSGSEKNITLPQNINFSNSTGSIKTSYTKEGNTVNYYREISIHKLLITPEEFEKWQQFITQLNSTYSSAIELQY